MSPYDLGIAMAACAWPASKRAELAGLLLQTLSRDDREFATRRGREPLKPERMPSVLSAAIVRGQGAGR